MIAIPCHGSSAAQDVPLPDRNPMRANSDVPAHPPHPRERKAEEWSAQDIQIARDRCAMMLAGSGVVYEYIPSIREGVCGAPSPILLRSVGKATPVVINPPATVTCGLAATLDAWSDTVLHPLAEKHLGSTVQAIQNVASYVCRNRYNAPDKRVSQHALANAIDMASFTLADGQHVSVLDHWHETEKPVRAPRGTTEDLTPPAPAPGTVVEQSLAAPPAPQILPEPATDAVPTPRARFLHDLHAGACTFFGTVLGPLANDAHNDHFHFDLAQRNHGNFCE